MDPLKILQISDLPEDGEPITPKHSPLFTAIEIPLIDGNMHAQIT